MRKRTLKRRLRNLETRLADLERLRSPKRRHLRDLHTQMNRLERRLRRLSRPAATVLKGHSTTAG